ncbi:hypothetical protein Tco_1027103, partial [Tanacetum coccineum]
ESGQILDEEQLAFLADPGIPDGQAAQTTIPNNVAFQTEDLDAYDSDYDDVFNAKAVLMANLPTMDFQQTPVVDFLDNKITSDSNIIPYSQYLQETQQEAVQDTNLYAQQDSMEKTNQEKNNESLTAELERYKERVKTFEHRLNIDLSTREKMIDSQMDDMIKEKLSLKQQIDPLEKNLSNQIKEKESLLQTFTIFKDESKKKESKYMDEEIDLEKKIKELDNIVYKVGQSAQIVHIDIDFGRKLSAEQAFWLQTSHPNTDQSDISPVKTEAPKEHPKCSDLDAELLKKQNAYNELLKSYSQLEKHCISLELTMQLNQDIFQKDKSCNNQNALEILEYFKNNDLKAQLQAKDTTIHKLKEHIKSMRENDKEEKVKQDMDEIETINIELEHKQCDSLIAQLNSKSMENASLKGKVQEKVFVTTALQNELKRLKGKNMLDNSTTIAPRMFKLDLDPLAPRIISTKVVPLKETTSQSIETQKPEIKVYSIRPNQVKSVGFPDCSLASIGSKSSGDATGIAKSWITCDNTNRNTTLSEAYGVSLRITSGMRELYTTFSTLAGNLRWRRRSWVFDLNKSDLCPSFGKGLTAKGLGPLRGGFLERIFKSRTKKKDKT